MPRPTTEMLTEREAQIMDVLWRLGEAVADDVRARLPGDPHDSTVRTLLRILESKGYVVHRTSGKSYVYRPAVDRSQAQRSALRSFLGRLFEGSAEKLVISLIEEEELTFEQLEQIRKPVQSRRAKRRNGESP